MIALAEPHQLGPRLGRRLADLGADLDHRLVQLGLDLLAEDELALFEDLRDVRLQLPGRGVDDLVLFLDAERQRRRLHGFSAEAELPQINAGERRSDKQIVKTVRRNATGLRSDSCLICGHLRTSAANSLLSYRGSTRNVGTVDCRRRR